MKPTRTTQPYRKGARQPGPALTAMVKGRGMGPNAADVKRAGFLIDAGQKGGGRAARPPRGRRPPRTPR